MLEEEEVEEGEGVPVVEEDVPTEMSLLRTENVNTKVSPTTHVRCILPMWIDRDSESFAECGPIRIPPPGGWLDGTPYPSTQLHPPHNKPTSPTP